MVTPVVAPPGWKLDSVTKLSPADLARFGDRLGVDKELGVTSAAAHVYALGGVRVTAIFEEAADPSSAYALYTIYRNSRMKPVPGVELASKGAEAALLTRGRYFIRVLRPQASALTSADIRSLLVAIGGARLSPENAESLPPHLPNRDLEPGTEKYILGPAALKVAFPSIPAPLIGFDHGAEVTSGTYLVGGERLTLLDISYPTPQIAELQYKRLASKLGIRASSAERAAIYGRQDGSYALLVLGARSASSADRLLSHFRVRQIVTQVPRYPRHDNFTLQLVELVIANGELVVIILVLAIMGGVLIYAAKRLIMKLFPNSAWIPPDEDVLIRLKLT